MTTTDQAQPVRRSPLERVHTSLGAAWVAEDARWPSHYGDASSEAVLVEQHAGVADIGPVDQLMVRGRHTAAALETLGISPTSRRVVRSASDVDAWCLGPDEAWLLVARDGPAVAELARVVRASRAAVTDVSSGNAVLRLVGPAAPDILAEVSAVDVGPAALAPAMIVQVPMAGVRVSLARLDHATAVGYTLVVARDQAEHLRDSLRMLGAAHGLAPVGPAAVGGLGETPAAVPA